MSKPVVFGNGSPMTIERLDECEALIKAALTASQSIEPQLTAGREALKEIHDTEGWRLNGYTSFSQYCRRCWHISRQAAYQQIAVLDVREGVKRLTGQAPTLTQRQAQALKQLPAEGQAEVMREVGPTATTAQVREEVQRRRPNFEQPTTLGRAVQKLSDNKPTPLHQDDEGADLPETFGEVVETPAPFMARVAARHSVNALRSDWSRALGAMRSLVRVYAAADVLAALNPSEVAEATSAFIEWIGWIAKFEEAGS